VEATRHPSRRRAELCARIALALVTGLVLGAGCNGAPEDGREVSAEAAQQGRTHRAAGRTGLPAMPAAQRERSKQGEKEQMLSEQARRTLLRLARQSVEAAVKGERLGSVQVDDPELQGRQGAFVTLKTHGQLRGCIGCFTSEQPLWRTVMQMAADSALRDPRFWGMRLRPKELADLEIEISVLSPMERIENPLDLELGKHGIYIRRGGRSGCFLPQVATETGWSKEEFLSQCCAGKAGLAPDAWKEPGTEVFVFTAEVISEAEEQSRPERP